MDTDPDMGMWTVLSIAKNQHRLDKLQRNFLEQGMRLPDVHLMHKRSFFESYRDFLEACIARGAKYSAVFEDDCELEPGAKAVLDRAWATLLAADVPWTMLYLGTMNFFPPVPSGKALWRVHKCLMTHAVIFTQRGLRLALDKLDSGTFGSTDVAIRGLPHQYSVYPPQAFQNEPPKSLVRMNIRVEARTLQKLSYEPFLFLVIFSAVLGAAALGLFVAALVFAARRPL